MLLPNALRPWGTVAIKDESPQDGPRYYRANLSVTEATRLNNYHMVSIGLIVPDDMKPATLKAWVRRGKAWPITHDEWNHDGCKSSCVKRGGRACRW